MSLPSAPPPPGPRAEPPDRGDWLDQLRHDHRLGLVVGGLILIGLAVVLYAAGLGPWTAIPALLGIGLVALAGARRSG